MNYRIKDLCKEKGITMSELADSIEMKSANLSASLSDKGNPTVSTLERIAVALEVSFVDLFERPDDNCFRCPKCGTTLEIKEK